MADDQTLGAARTAIVTTSNGPICGYREDRLHVFKGVRYGAPPIGALRFKPPARPTPWTSTADAVTLGAPAVQGGSVPGEAAGGRSGGDPAAPGQPVSSEDCLFLNVWTQGLDTARRPVMVWLHGGGFAAGSGGAAMYDGGNLARRGDVVTVTVNHRLNVFGYLHLGDIFGAEYSASGQAGMLDIVMVLEWVRDNISKFGGDPANVTIFGESGGGAKVSMLLAMPAAQGLFHKAIIQSGPGLRAVPRDRATALAKALLDELKITDAAALQAAPGDLIARAATEAPRALAPIDDAARNASFSPCVDGNALPGHPFHPEAPAMSRDIPVMIGTNKDESTLFLRGAPDFGTVTEEKLRERTVRSAGDKADALLGALRALHPDYSPTYLQCAVQTAQGMWLGSVTLAERKSAQAAAPVWMYMLTWETPVARGALKSPHALEIPLIMDNVERARDFVGRGDDPQTMADQMAPAWLAFARTGNPNTAAIPHWPAYDASNRATMMFNLTSRVETDPDRSVREILQA